jgi:hypothetical protein
MMLDVKSKANSKAEAKSKSKAKAKDLSSDTSEFSSASHQRKSEEKQAKKAKAKAKPQNSKVNKPVNKPVSKPVSKAALDPGQQLISMVLQGKEANKSSSACQAPVVKAVIAEDKDEDELKPKEPPRINALTRTAMKLTLAA